MPWQIPQNSSEMVQEQPRLLELEQRLLAKAGQAVALLPEPDLDELLAKGNFIKPQAVWLVPGRAGRCHTNTVRLWEKSNGNMRIFTGWSLAQDGRWYQHSWGALWGKLVETTEPRLLYFGYELTNELAAEFWQNQMRRLIV